MKFAADPFMIATAEVHSCTVVTDETGSTSPKKIPGVCDAMQVPWCSLVELFDAEDWTIG